MIELQEPMKRIEQVRSKARVTDHGEVFTPEREVNAMLDLVKQETERIDSRFLEPACGNGNFLAEVLRRKLVVVERRYAKSQVEFERYAVISISSIYGVDLLADNVVECRERLLKIFEDKYFSLYKGKTKDECRDSVKFILGRNILMGDALSLKTADGTPLIFSEWGVVNGNKIKRRDFLFEELSKDVGDLFSQTFKSDIGHSVFIPKPVKEFPLAHMFCLNEYVSS